MTEAVILLRYRSARHPSPHRRRVEAGWVPLTWSVTENRSTSAGRERGFRLPRTCIFRGLNPCMVRNERPPIENQRLKWRSNDETRMRGCVSPTRRTKSASQGSSLAAKMPGFSHPFNARGAGPSRWCRSAVPLVRRGVSDASLSRISRKWSVEPSLRIRSGFRRTKWKAVTHRPLERVQ